ncbi:CoxG family protein [Alicyclobacillus sp. SO9]|uniref:CoxG family protein n=1 Tax=Alicyclobacillus sp. SO9 TaxID=2665646 RepID=UPI0018E818A6|nr:carbon monoxide dehydrogenase subunit G [Alicyclobacillus sp. SO9]QQE77746.1 carbon monoxide dehydrogenase subunit G [Alicyclobacillus sp. SO9]
MLVSGTKDFPTSPEDTFKLLTNPDVIVKAMPGMKSLERITEHSFKASMEVGVGGIKGAYDGQLDLKDVHPGKGYRLVVHGEGQLGFMDADVKMTLAPADNGTTLSYNGEAKVGGTVAGVGQRMLSGVARMLINQFFNHVLQSANEASKA